MVNARENLNQSLKVTDFNIGGDVFRAYYDPNGKLLFVVDYLITDIKPKNVKL